MTKEKIYTDLIFDLDGTIYDTFSNAQQALKELYTLYDLQNYIPQEKTFLDAFWKANIALWNKFAKGEISKETLYAERFKTALNNNKTTLPPHLSKELNNKFISLSLAKKAVMPDAHTTLQELKHRNYRLHICTNGTKDEQYQKQTSTNTLQYFQTVILSEDAQASKPSPQFFDYALKTTGAQKETTIMIGDSYETDILGAQNSGLSTIFFNPYATEPTSSHLPTTTISALKDLLQILK